MNCHVVNIIEKFLFLKIEDGEEANLTRNDKKKVQGEVDGASSKLKFI